MGQYQLLIMDFAPYLIDKPVPAHSRGARAHNFVLLPKDNRNFVSRALYEALCPSYC